jgi:mono/diheme cytochrome c family protein
MPDAERGRKQFHDYCAACHQADGRGSDDTPPLAGSSWVAGPENRLVKIVLDGVRGPMEVNGKTYDREMPGFGQVLSDADVAALLSFVRREFGASSDPITLEAVRQIRSTNRTRTDYWTTQELLEDK